MLGPDDLPFAVGGHRVLILEKPVKEVSDGGIIMPDTAKMRYFSGILLDAGLPARDKLYDQGYNIGDEVEFGMYAGLREAWDHVIEGDHTLPAESYDWKHEDRSPTRALYRCRNTGALRAVESVIVLNVDDLIASVELAARRRRGEVEIVRGQTADGKTQHVFRRVQPATETVTDAAKAEERSNVNGHA